MIIGITAASLTFISLIVSSVAYFLYYGRQEESLLKIARLGFYTAGVLIAFQSALLMWGIIAHKFEWSYVFSYSSKDLAFYYLISTFWAGQEGTFLLWALLGSIYGLAIIRWRKEEEPLVMCFMNLSQAFIIMILIKENPFTYIWDVNPMRFAVGVTPVDGSGLNPLLQDPWMTIHPPVLFAGYASSAILFAYAMSALIKKDYESWIKGAFPFALFAGLTIGAGIILGAYWAYTTLGWGGFWGWDPVENSSLIPWLVSFALIHGMIVQRKQGGMKKTNIFLALFTFILVLYSTFLTRSGVLTDFSVHSFGASTLTLYLTAFVLFFLIIGVFTFLFRIKEVKGEKVQTAFFTRESYILFGVLVILILAIYTFMGTSSPIITGLFGTASNVSTDYYNLLAAPAAVLMALLIAIAPLLSWKNSSPEKLKKYIVHGVLSLISGIVIFFLGMKDIILLALTIISIFIIISSGGFIFKMIRKKNYDIGAYLTHTGVALMFIGIITSSVYDKSVRVSLPIDENVSVMGFDLKYTGQIASPDGKDKVIIKVNEKETYANFFWSDYSRAYMVTPSVQNMLLKDLYISPIKIIPADQNLPPVEIILKKGQSLAFEDYYLLLTGYDMGTHSMGGDMNVAALIEVSDKEGTKIETIKPVLTFKDNKRNFIPADLPGSSREVYVKEMNVESGSIIITVSKQGAGNNAAPAGKELLAVEVSIKPLIIVLWLGTILMMLGFITSIYHRAGKKMVIGA